ncbi:MAG: hypothetical protein RI983_1741 [Bacteroidota bacterium]
MVLALAFTTSLAHAQNNGSSYQTALGVKMYPGAISVKHFTQKGRALEGLGYLSNDGFRLTGLYELHFPIEGAEGLQWYVGGGGHIGVWSDNWKSRYPGRADRIAIGVDGILGLDYKIKGAPLNLSFDWQPSFNFIGYNYFEGGWGGLAIRYTF